MWVRLWMVLITSLNAFSQTTHTRVQHGGASFEWGWQLNPADSTGAGGQQYYVKLPEVSQGFQNLVPNNTQLLQGNLPFVDIYLLNQQLTPPISQQGQIIQYLPNPVLENAAKHNSIPNYSGQSLPTQATYDVNTQYRIDHDTQYTQGTQNENVSSQSLQKKEVNGEEHHEALTSDVVQVFKDHNCTDDVINGLENVPQDYVSNDKKSMRLTAESPTYEVHNINGNFGIRQTTERPLTYKGAVTFTVEPQRENARNERYYYTTNVTPTPNTLDPQEDDGISKLVASTQDLISNEDLLRINHAVEKQINTYNDDIIKPRPRFSLTAEQTRYGHNTHSNDNRFTVKAKIENVVNSEIEHVQNNESKEQVLQTNSNEYKFASPIVVEDSTYNDFKDQIVNNLVSTMVPYMSAGYEISGVRESLVDNYTNRSSDDTINVTPRPIGQQYLAPITVALRLLNANNTDVLNSVDDHEASDSEVVEETVKSPRKETTTVEIQPSIPVDITHINDVEVHEYLEEGRSNNKGPFDTVKYLYNKYVDTLESSRRIQNNMNQQLYKYGTMKNYDDTNYEAKNDNYNDGKERIESSENMQRVVEVKPNGESNDRKEFVRDYYDYSTENQKIIQPIIIEKQVPITKFVDRFIEKQVPYPEPVEVVKEVPVDRPVAVPVPYDRVIEKPVEVTKYIDKPYPIEVPQPYPIEVKVPYPIEQKVFVDRPIHVPYPVEKLIEKQIIHPVPIPTPVAVPVQVPVEQKVLLPVPIETPVPYVVEVEKPVTVEKIVQKEVPVPYPIEKKIPYAVHYETKVPVPYAMEKRVPVAVERIVEKPVTITKVVEKPVKVEVPVPQPVPVTVHFAHPYPVDRVVEKQVPYPVPVDRIVERKVPVRVPYAVEKVVEKIIEKPVLVTKYIDKPYPVEKRVPYPVEKIIEKKVPYPVHVPVEFVPYPVGKVEKPSNVPYKYDSYNKVPYKFEQPAYVKLAQEGQHSQSYPQYHKYTEQKDTSPLQTNALYQKYVDQNKVSNQQYQQNQAEANYHKYLPEQQTTSNQMNQQNIYAAQYLKDKQKSSEAVNGHHWGNLYASSYQHINQTTDKVQKLKKTPAYNAYVSYVTNSKPYNYHGPPPVQNYDNAWEQNNDYLVELKLRRTDRMPKMTNLRIEYGGFKPPLIPSTEVDLDGIPVKKEETH